MPTSKRPRGRPRREGETAEKIVRARLTTPEHERYSALAKARRMTLSDLIRYALERLAKALEK